MVVSSTGHDTIQPGSLFAAHLSLQEVHESDFVQETGANYHPWTAENVKSSAWGNVKFSSVCGVLK